MYCDIVNSYMCHRLQWTDCTCTCRSASKRVPRHSSVVRRPTPRRSARKFGRCCSPWTWRRIPSSCFGQVGCSPTAAISCSCSSSLQHLWQHRYECTSCSMTVPPKQILFVSLPMLQNGLDNMLGWMFCFRTARCIVGFNLPTGFFLCLFCCHSCRIR